MGDKTRQSPIREVGNVFSEYSRTSTVHGVRYLCDKKRPWSERMWWLISVSTSVFLCAGFLVGTWNKWAISPLIITFADEATQLSNIPFPTITICNDFMVNTSALNYSGILEQLSKEEFSNINLNADTVQKVYSLAHFCAPPVFLGEYIEHKGYAVDRKIMKNLQELEARLFHPRDRCYLAGHEELRCEALFSQILTDSGICYTFNHLSSDDIYKVNLLADDFPKVSKFSVSHQINAFDVYSNGSTKSENLSYPYTMRNAGTGLEIKMWVPETENHFDPMCDGLLEGLKVQVHSAQEVPQLNKFFYHIPFDHDVRITVYPDMMTTSSSIIKSHNQEQRKCIAEKEHDLVFFKNYTQHNCFLDTLATESFRICKCVLFWMPRFNETKMCRFSSEFKCVEHVENSIHHADLTSKCIPACNSINYYADISTSKRAVNPFEPDGFKRVNVLVLFKDQQYYSASRSELYGKMDFIDFTAACGGILNLFMGISILSILEIVYFATFRLARNLIKRNSKSPSMSNDEDVEAA